MVTHVFSGEAKREWLELMDKRSSLEDQIFKALASIDRDTAMCVIMAHISLDDLEKRVAPSIVKGVSMGHMLANPKGI